MPPSTRFWNKTAESYAKSPISDEASYQRKLEITRTYLKPDMELLEFGCGTGSTALIHAPRVRHIHAIDFSANMIEIAQGKARAAGVENVTFEEAVLDDLRGTGRTYDGVLGLSILHLLKDWEGAIAQVYALLKPGGFFASSTVCMGDGLSIMRWVAPIGQALGQLPEIAVFRQKALEDALTGVGFEIEERFRPEGWVKAVFIVGRKAG